MEGATLSTGCFRTSYQFLVPSVVYSPLSGCSALVLEHASLSSAGAQSMPAHTFTVERLLPFSCFLTTSLLTCSHVWHLQRPPLAAPQRTSLSVPRVDMQTWCALFSPCAVKLHWAHLSAHYNSCLPLMPQAWGAILPSAMTSASSYQGHEKSACSTTDMFRRRLQSHLHPTHSLWPPSRLTTGEHQGNLVWAPPEAAS